MKSRIAVCVLMAACLVSGQAAADDGGDWVPMDQALKKGWKIPKSYLMAGTGFLSGEVPSRSGASVSGVLAEVGLGMKIGQYLAVEGRYFSAPNVSGDGLSGEVKGYGSGLTAYLPINKSLKAFARYDILHVETDLQAKSGTGHVDIDARSHAVTAGVEARIVGKNYMRASWQRIEADKNAADIDIYEVAYLRRLF